MTVIAMSHKYVCPKYFMGHHTNVLSIFSLKTIYSYPTALLILYYHVFKKKELFAQVCFVIEVCCSIHKKNK